ncbi:MAG: hypothetical protein JHC26_03290 [Thermofilum sp.]|jgi:hypothetical protein|uniref:hypothetical protein n=1 Tax=Thermofilum sp. TaxID=1961369 RepID=UPI002589A9C8|nr:hypothetical protein [Thermofilum sp.]MCI4408093.1 hypothetical protein [Thermofilum sp.]
MNVIDPKREVELAIKTVIFGYKTKHVYLRADKVKKANPRLKDLYISYVGKIMSQVLQEYEAKGLIRILGIKRNHVSKFYIRVLKPYSDYAKKLEQEVVA